MEKGETTTITTVIPEWYQEVANSYESDESVKEILEQLVLDPNSKKWHALQNEVLQYKGRIVVGDCPQVKLEDSPCPIRFPFGWTFRDPKHIL